MYTTLASLLYLAGAVIASMICILLAIRNPSSVRKALNRGCIVTGVATLVCLTATTVLSVVSDVPSELIASALMFWVLVFLAVPMVPVGLELQARTQALSPWRVTLIAVVSAAVAFAGSLLWMLGAGAILKQFDMTITPSPFLQEVMDSPGVLAVMMPLALAAAVIEEVIFRLGIQGLLEAGFRRLNMPAGFAVIIASGIWALGHAGYADPSGVKESQIFAMGLLFGWLKLRYGISASIGAHLGHNALAIAAEVLFDAPVGG